MQYPIVVAVLLLAACGRSSTGPELGRDPLDGAQLVATIANRAPSISGEAVDITEVVRWEFHGGHYRFTVQTADPGVPLHYSPRRPRTVYSGNYWITYRDRRLYTLHLERTGGVVYSRANGDRSLPSKNNIEMPVLFGVEVVTISETDYTYEADH